MASCASSQPPRSPSALILPLGGSMQPKSWSRAANLLLTRLSPLSQQTQSQEDR